MTTTAAAQTTVTWLCWLSLTCSCNNDGNSSTKDDDNIDGGGADDGALALLIVPCSCSKSGEGANGN
jgi:hypothetical protein